MKKLTIAEAEALARKFRIENEIGIASPIDVKTLLRQLKITAMFRPLSRNSYGISCKSKSGKLFMLINSNSTIGRQHFTIAHELYHLLFEANPLPHICQGVVTNEEFNANLFASVLLLPREGVCKMVSYEETKSRNVNLATILRTEQMFQVSRQTLLARLRGMGLVSDTCFNKLQQIPVKESAQEYGYGISLYEQGNEGETISDFGEKARLLFESGKLSEGHYMELLNMISYDKKED
ncbi:MAG: ImmA/IrrE family metallo-endopeptidase [Paludibacteraceae bacterium]|nr:ImmA/IrrE family metallo-endopeptidase [Paludibacteraceae bacterium]